MWQFVALIAVGLVQLGLGFAGIEYHLGVFWAFAAIVVAFWFRILLPITIGSFFGVVDVMGWPWYIGVAVALPGLMFIAPSMVMAAIEVLNETSGQKNKATEYRQQSRSVPQQGNNNNGAPKTSKTEGGNFKQGAEARRATPNEKTLNMHIPIVPEAEIILQYVDEARLQLERLNLHPGSIRTKYLELIIESGGADPQHSFREAVVWGLGGDIEYDSNLEESLKILSTIGAPAVEEFYRVVPTLKKTMPIIKIMEAVAKRLELKEPEIIIVKGAGNIQKRVHVHQNGCYSLFSPTGEEKYFQSIEKVYEYLGTPAAFRTNHGPS